MATPSQEPPGPDKEKLLGDLLGLLDQHPEALRDLKGRFDAGDSEKPTEPTGTPVVPAPKNASSPASDAFPALRKPLVPATPLQVPPGGPTKAAPGPAVDSHANRKTPMQLHPPPDSRPVAAPNSPNTPLNPPVPTPLPIGRMKEGIWQKIGGRSLAIAITTHVFLLIIGVFWVLRVIDPPEKKVDFLPAGGGGSERGAKDVSVKKMKQITPTTNVKRVFAEGAKASYAIPEQGDDFGEISALSSLSAGGMSGGLGGSGLGSVFGKGSGSGAGSTLGGAGSGKLFGPLNLFGARGGVGLVGSFYDLKQTPDKMPTGVNADNYTGTVRDWVNGGMIEQDLSKYFKAPTSLSAAHFMIPDMPAEEAPKAYGVEKQVQVGQWLAVYRGLVQAPADGAYHFIGAADDVLLVRVNGQLVLDASWEDSSGLKPAGIIPPQYTGFPRGGYIKGKSVNFTAKTWTPIEVVIGERPGGRFWGVLMVQPAEGRSATIPLFRLEGGKQPPAKGAAFPKCDERGSIWRVQSGAGSAPLDALKRP